MYERHLTFLNRLVVDSFFISITIVKVSISENSSRILLLVCVQHIECKKKRFFAEIGKHQKLKRKDVLHNSTNGSKLWSVQKQENLQSKLSFTRFDKYSIWATNILQSFQK